MRPPPSESGRRWIGLPVLLVGSVLLASCGDLRDEVPTSPEVEGQAAERQPLAEVAALQDFGPAIQAANRATGALMQIPGVVGTGVGLNEDGRPAVRIFLVHDQVRGIPSALDDVPTDPVVTGRFELRSVDRTARARPAPIGFSVGHPDITAGTLGARVTDGTNVFILSNNHVLANSNDADIGDSALQPGSFDGGSDPADAIGTLHDYYEIVFGSGGENTMDAAIALVDGADVSGSTPDEEGYGAPSTNPTNPSVGQSVQKYGRTTGHTTGTVEEINVTVTVCFAGFIFCSKSATFVNQFTITPGSFSDGGDSGSLIVTDTNQNDPVGLLFAGSSTRTIANPITAVLDHFGVSIDPTVPDDDNGNGEPDPEPDPEPGELSIDQFDVDTRTSGPWQRATVSWAVSHTGGGLESVTTELLVDGSVVDSQTSSVSGSSASGEHELRTRSGTPDTVRITVTDGEGNKLVEEKPYN